MKSREEKLFETFTVNLRIDRYDRKKLENSLANWNVNFCHWNYYEFNNSIPTLG